MRVISGRAKGRRLKSVPGDTTRPMLDRVKESLFNILGPGVAGTRWLDLFAGTGQVGIEALSRGAAHAVFVDTSAAAIRTVNDNLAHTRLADDAEVIRSDAFAYLGRAASAVRGPGARQFDVIYVAPPQYHDLWRQAVEALDHQPDAGLVSPDGQVIVQIDPKEYVELELTHLELYDERRYGNTLLCFYGLRD